jgi:hypothetical protein
VAGHEGIEGNKMADELAKSEPEAACGISAGIVKKVVRDRTNWGHKIYCESLTNLKGAKVFVQGSSVTRTKELIKVNRMQLRRVTGHCRLKGYYFKMGLTDSPNCDRCAEKVNQSHTST